MLSAAQKSGNLQGSFEIQIVGGGGTTTSMVMHLLFSMTLYQSEA